MNLPEVGDMLLELTNESYKHEVIYIDHDAENIVVKYYGEWDYHYCGIPFREIDMYKVE